MSYWLGIDVGTTFTAAAICRQSGVPEVVALGTRSTAVSSVLYLAPDGQVVVGEAAERRAVSDPDRVVREFKRRIGDEVPMVIGGQGHAAPEIAAMVLGWVIDRVAAQEGGPASGIVVTHPAGWGPYKISTMTAAVHAAGLTSITFCTEPEAAAASYALASRIEQGATIAVYDLGGGTFDAAVVRKTGPTTLQVLGVPQGLDALGGADFDDAIMGHVLAAVPALTQLDPDDPATLAATATLRRDCTEAKEALSCDTEVTIPVLAPGVQTHVRLIRAEFEDMIRPQLEQTVEALRRALKSANIEPDDLDAILLVGGSSRIPLVTQLISAALDRPVAIDTDPKAAIALGAALCALPTPATAADAPSEGDIEYRPVDGGAVTEAAALAAGSQLAATTPAEVPQRPSLTALPLDVEPAELQWRKARSRRVKQVVLAGALAVFTVAGVASVPFLTSRSGPTPPANAGTSTSSTPAAPNVRASGVPAPDAPAPGAAVPAPNSAIGSDNSSNSGGPIRTAPRAAPNRPAGGPAPVAPSAPPPSWVSTYTWTSTWSSPPPATTTPPPTTTEEPPPPTTTAAVTTTAVATTAPHASHGHSG